MSAPTSTMHAAIAALKRGEAVIFPTDTVYGLGVSIEAAASPDVLYDLKERDRGKPIAWLVGGAGDLERYGVQVPAFARALAHTFWPGPLTLIVKAGIAVPAAFRSQADSIGLRMPNNATALELVRAAGCPLATTSANIAGHPASRSLDALDPDLVARVGVVVGDNGDDTDKSGVASTVVDCTHETPAIVREGVISLVDIQRALV